MSLSTWVQDLPAPAHSEPENKRRLALGQGDLGHLKRAWRLAVGQGAFKTDVAEHMHHHQD